MVLIVLVICLQFGYNFTKTGSVLGKVVTITANGLLSETNDRRAEAGLAPLTLNDQLSRAAALKANDMIQNQYWDHISPSGVDPWQWIDESGYRYEEAGENLAKGFSTAGGAVAGWMDSNPHRANVLKSSYTDVGFAVTTGELNGEPTTIVVALYAKPAANTTLSLTSNPYTVSATPVNQSKQAEQLSPAGRLGIAIQSLTPAALTSLILLLIAISVAATAQLYRRKLPKRLQKTWYKDHGIIKASGLFAIAAFVILLYGGGQV